MRIRGPIVTLLVGVVIAAVLLIVSSHAKSSPSYGQKALTPTVGQR